MADQKRTSDLLQMWRACQGHPCNLADLACEEALYDRASLRSFVGIDLGREPVPHSTTIASKQPKLRYFFAITDITARR